MVTLQDFVQHLVPVANKRTSFFEILLHGRWFSSNIYEREAYMKTMHYISRKTEFLSGKICTRRLIHFEYSSIRDKTER